MSSAGHEEAGRWQRLDVVIASIVCAGTILLCVPAVWNLSRYWSDNEFYGHAYLMPLFAGWLVYSNRRPIAEALRAPRPPLGGPLVVLAAGAFEVLMFIGDVGSAAGLGVPVLVGAVAYAIGGSRLVRPLSLPLVFLALMVPPPAFLLDPLLVWLKLTVTELAVSLLQASGMTVGAEGTQILVPGHRLFVADACSGLTSIITMLPIACVIAYALNRGVWRRAIVIVSVIPLAMAANVIRVIVTVKLVSRIGIEAAQGSLHEGFGVATYAIGTLAVVGVARLMR